MCTRKGTEGSNPSLSAVRPSPIVAFAIAAALGAWLAVVIPSPAPSRPSLGGQAASVPVPVPVAPTPRATQSEPSLAVGIGGTVCAAWLAGGRVDAPRIDLRCVHEDAGYEWTASAGEHPGGTVAHPLVAAAPDGGFWLAWLSRGDRNVVMLAKIDLRSGRVGAPVEVTTRDETVASERPALAVGAAGGVLVAYARTTGGSPGLAVARSENGSTFTRSALGESTGRSGRFAAICASSGRAWVAYLLAGEGVVVRRSDDDGASWSDDARAVVSGSEEELAPESPACAAVAGQPTVAYGVAAARGGSAPPVPLARVVVVRSRDGGATFTVRHEQQEPARVLMLPAITAGWRGEVQLAYFAGRADGDEGGSLRLARLGGGGTVGSLAVREPLRFAAGSSGDALGLASGNGTTWAAYVDGGRVAFAQLAGD
jgi:hypothetical protein